MLVLLSPLLSAWPRGHLIRRYPSGRSAAFGSVRDLGRVAAACSATSGKSSIRVAPKLAPSGKLSLDQQVLCLALTRPPREYAPGAGPTKVWHAGHIPEHTGTHGRPTQTIGDRPYLKRIVAPCPIEAYLLGNPMDIPVDKI
jgi:hypothetical protein